MARGARAVMGGHALAFRPGLWWRFCHRLPWPWRPKRAVLPSWGKQPYIVEVRERGTTIGWHSVDSLETTTVIEIGRWTAFSSLFRPARFEIRQRTDLAYGAPSNREADGL